ncbi:hypothetical protein [Staphylothermus hellenicus]|uniref:Uncharacterized protein n=1 Tax=Staphylothermus hellenicus (strain DSM 12710 / JCM 10830 / BK20S6-10-b1 / P8) TaxID=591019 RepID=D7DAY6_STAHD|nr:hypothetical protein [Staphylothermus hellenicus]ADI31333.1 hypothetical protein Shell_0191 [Staphylothermus hellenicus DSM 12710]
MPSRRENSIIQVYEQVAMEATRYYWLGSLARIGLASSSIVVLAASTLILWITLNPLYVFKDPLINGEVGFVYYSLYSFGKPLQIPVLDSLTKLSFILIFSSTLSSALVAPALVTVLVKPKMPRIYLEVAAAGNAIGGLNTSLLISFLRVLYMNIISSIPITASIHTQYGVFIFYRSTSWYTEVGLLSLRLWPIYPVLAGVLIGSAGATIYYITRYYEEILELPPIPVNPT